jgi:hypothetical protein
MHALIYLCEHFNLHDQAAYWRAVLQMDQFQRRRLVEIVMNHIPSLKGKRAAVLGFAYKASTSDVRGSPSLDLIRSLLQEGASVYIYDPRVAAEDVMKACDYHRDVHVAGVNMFFSFRQILSLTRFTLCRCAQHHGRCTPQRLRSCVHRLGRVQIHRLALDGFGDAGFIFCPKHPDMFIFQFDV